MLDHKVTPHQKPVIFLAFANDKVNPNGYLRNLAREKRGIRKALEQCENTGLCEVVVRSDCTLDDLIDVFQGERYRGRIAVFHFAGHADSFHLLLETEDGKHAPAFKTGTIDYFARQEGLKLIFLNGCSTSLQAKALRDAGIPAVVGTVWVIDDAVATKLSVRFYHALANGTSLLRAWRETEDYIKTQAGDSNINALYREFSPQYVDRLPWDMYFKEGAEKVKEWSLPAAANNPLFGLPPLTPQGALPGKPFRYLEPYRAVHAEVFFGRSYEIRELYNYVSDEWAPPVLLLYGQTGVGKSSLLQAGLMPRLTRSFNPQYERREKEKGLLDTLRDKLTTLASQHQNSPSENAPVQDLWRFIEIQIDKPLVIILDQVEEMNTTGNEPLPNEWQFFMETLKPLFSNPSLSPRGKLILSFRKEYYSDISDLFKAHHINRADIFIRPLNRKHILDVVTGLTRDIRLIKKYNLEITDLQLPGIIADDLLTDQDSPIAPTLQIIMTRMWDDAENDKLPPAREFTLQRYHTLKKQGLLMEDFFDRQMTVLGEWNAGVLESGLALDVLNYHTTLLGTSVGRDIDDIRVIYRHRKDIIEDLVHRLKHHYLLSDTPHKSSRTRLAHDTLAPIVSQRYNCSDKPGQRAIRILNAKLDLAVNSSANVYLDKTDITTVEQGCNGMRKLNWEEQELLESSKKQVRRLERKAKFRTIEKGVLAALFLFLAIFFQWQQQIGRMSKAAIFALQARMWEYIDPTAALALAQNARQLVENQLTFNTINRIYREHQFYKKIVETPENIASETFSPDGRYTLASFHDNNASIWDWQGVPVTRLIGHNSKIVDAAFAPDNSVVLTGSMDMTARLWNLDGYLKNKLEHRSPVMAVAFSPHNQRILTGTASRKVHLWNRDGTLLNSFRGFDGAISWVAAGAEPGTLFAASDEATLYIKKSQSKGFKVLFHYPQRINQFSLSPRRDRILTASRDKTAALWNLKGEPLQYFSGHQAQVTAAVFSPCGLYVLTGSADHSARLWDLKGNQLNAFYGHSGHVTSAGFSANGGCILTGSADDTIRLWQLKDIHTRVLYRSNSTLTSMTHPRRESYLLTGNLDGEIRLWESNGILSKQFQVSAYPVSALAFSPNRQTILAGDGFGEITLWDIQLEKPIWRRKKHQTKIIAVAYSNKGNSLISASSDGTVCLWSNSGEIIKCFKAHQHHMTSAVFSHDVRYMLTGSSDKSATLWDCNGNRLKDFKGHTGEVSAVAIDPGNRYIFTGSRDRTAKLWDWQGRHIMTLKTPGRFVYTAAFSRGGNYIATATNDNAIRLWDRKGNQIQVYKGHSGAIVSLSFFGDAGDKQSVISGSEDGTVRQWKTASFKAFLKDGVYQSFSRQRLEDFLNEEDPRNEEI